MSSDHGAFTLDLPDEAEAALVLTERLGTGVLNTAVRRGHLPADALRPAIDSMVTLNQAAADAMVAVGVHAATDVTGFGLLGHLLRASSPTPVGAALESSRIPFDGVLGLAERQVSVRPDRSAICRMQRRTPGFPPQSRPTSG